MTKKCLLKLTELLAWVLVSLCVNFYFGDVCLGVTDGDWDELGQAALESLEFEIARLAFIKLQNFSYLELIQDLQVI